MKLSENKKRNRIEKLADTLRSFRIVDRFGLGDFILCRDSFSVSDLKRMIDSNKDALPSGVTSEYLAQVLNARLQEAPPELTRWRETYKSINPDLKKIVPGKKDASRYCGQIYKLLVAIFDGVLSNPKREQPAEIKLGFIDIVFDNTADSGFFLALKGRIPSDIIPIECKNYSDDLANTEYNQLYSRLKKSHCCFGLLVCRNINDKDKSLLHCRAKLTEQKYMLVLDDADVTLLYQLRASGNESGFNDFWGQKFRNIVL